MSMHPAFGEHIFSSAFCCACEGTISTCLHPAFGEPILSNVRSVVHVKEPFLHAYTQPFGGSIFSSAQSVVHVKELFRHACTQTFGQPIFSNAVCCAC